MTMLFDPSTADALQIIKRSILMHPSLFRDAVEARRKQDRDYAAVNTSPSVVRSIEASAKACTFGLKVIEAEDVSPLKGECGAGIILLDIACKLQCLPPHVRTAAAVRTWES